jgi:hypothetical protein
MRLNHPQPVTKSKLDVEVYSKYIESYDENIMCETGFSYIDVQKIH